MQHIHCGRSCWFERWQCGDLQYAAAGHLHPTPSVDANLLLLGAGLDVTSRPQCRTAVTMLDFAQLIAGHIVLAGG